MESLLIEEYCCTSACAVDAKLLATATRSSAAAEEHADN